MIFVPEFQFFVPREHIRNRSQAKLRKTNRSILSRTEEQEVGEDTTFRCTVMALNQSRETRNILLQKNFNIWDKLRIDFVNRMEFLNHNHVLIVDCFS